MKTPPRVDILLVDDNPAKVLALETALAPLGQRLIVASSGREALRQLLSHDFATVVLDVNMPGMDGFETAQLIRGRPRTAHTPIIFVSAVNLADTDALRGYALGAVDYIPAPIIPEVLRAKVSVFVELHRKTEEARAHALQVEERTRELQASQHQLRLAERMAALGTLSAGLGHDMGNLLLPIQARLETLDRRTLSPELGSSLEAIHTCVGHLQRLANGLRLLALDPDDSTSSEGAADLHAWWSEVEIILRNAVPTGVELHHRLHPGLPRLLLARHLLTQVIFNLVSNAGDALRVRASGRVTVWAEPAADPASVRVGVTDDGPGMSPEVERRCLEPFFTTKSRGLSTGLGLALVHGIVQKAGGAVEIDTRPGHGTTFSFTLPTVGAEPDQTGVPLPLAVLSMKDGRLRGFAVSLLQSLGFSVGNSADRERPDARLWLTDPNEGLIDDAPAFLRAGAGRRVLVLGPAPNGLAGRSGDHGAGVQNGEIVELDARPAPASLRRVLTQILGAPHSSSSPASRRPVESSL